MCNLIQSWNAPSGSYTTIHAGWLACTPVLLYSGAEGEVGTHVVRLEELDHDHIDDVLQVLLNLEARGVVLFWEQELDQAKEKGTRRRRGMGRGRGRGRARRSGNRRRRRRRRRYVKLL